MTFQYAISFLQDLIHLAQLLVKLGITCYLSFVLAFTYFKAVRVLARRGFRFEADVNPAAVGEHVVAATWVQVHVYLPSPTDQPNFGGDMVIEIVMEKFNIEWRNEFDRLQETGILSERIPTAGSEEER